MVTRITVEVLKEHLTYDPTTGVFRWLHATGNARNPDPPGTEAGYVDGDGARIIKIGSHTYRAHRLAWLYVTGHSPKGEIVHIDGHKDHNWILNLRQHVKPQAPRKRKYIPLEKQGSADSDFKKMAEWQREQKKADLAFQALLRASGVPEGVNKAPATSTVVVTPNLTVPVGTQSSIGGNFL